MADFDTQINVGMNVDGVVSGTEKAKRSVRDLGESARGAGKSLGGIGDGAGQSAQKVESATKSMIQSIQRTTAATEAGDKSTRAYQESLARLRGIDVAALKPYLDQLDQAKNKADAAARSADSLSKSLNNIKVASAIVAAAGAAFVAYAKGINNGVDALNDLKDATGASIENISALEDIALRTGTSFDTVGTSLIKLNQALNTAKPGSDTERAIKAIGLSVADLKALDPAEAFQKIAVSLSGYSDDANKARLTQELFGKSLKEIAPLLKDAAEAGKLVGTVTTAQAEAAEKLNKQIFSLQKNATDLSRAFVSTLVPAISEGADRFMIAYKNAGSLLGVLALYARLDYSKGIQGNLGQIESQIKSLEERATRITSESVLKGNDKMIADLKAQAQYLKEIRQQKILIAQGDNSDAVSRKFLDKKTSVGDIGSGPDKAALAAAKAARAQAIKDEIEGFKTMDEARKEYEKAMAEGLKGEIAAYNEYAKAQEAAQQKVLDGYQKAADSATQRASGLADEESAAALAAASNVSLAVAVEQLGLARAREAQAKALSAGADGATLLALQQEIEAREKIIGLLKNKESRESAADAAKNAASEWKKAAEQIEQSITDALFRGFESGKGFGENLRDTIVNTFKTMVLRPTVQAVVNPVSNAATNFLSTAGGTAGSWGSASSLPGMLGNITIAGSSLAAITGSVATGVQAGWAGTSIAAASEAYAAAGMTGVSTGLTAGSAIGSTAASISAGVSSALAAIPGWGWAAMAVLAIANMKGSYVQSLGESVATVTADKLVKLSGSGGNNDVSIGGGLNIRQTESSDKFVNGLASAFVAAASKLGLSTAGASFGFGSNNSDGGKFGLTATVGGQSYKTGDIKTSEAALQLEASRAVFFALQNSELPGYLSKVFDGLTASTAAQADIDAALNYASGLKTIRDALTETREPLQILKDTVADSLKALGTSADTFKLDFVAAIDAGISPDKLAQFQQLGANLEALAQSSGTAADGLGDVTKSLNKITEGLQSEGASLQAQWDQVFLNAEAYRTKQIAGMTDLQIAQYDTNEAIRASIAVREAEKTANEELAEAQRNAAETLAEAISTAQGAQAQAVQRFTAPLNAASAGALIGDNAVNAIQGKSSAEIRDMARAYVLSLDAQTLAGREAIAQFEKQAAAVDFFANAADTAAQAIKDAANATLQAAKDQTAGAFAGVQRAIDAQRRIAQTQLSVAGESVSALKSVFDTLAGGVKSLYDSAGIDNTANATSFLQQALATAQATGYLPDATQLADAVSAAVNGTQGGQYASQADAEFAKLALAGTLTGLKDITGSQLTSAEQAVKLAQRQLDTLDDTLKTAQDQLDALNGVDNSVQSVASAIASLTSAIAAQNGAQAAAQAIASTGSVAQQAGLQPNASAASVQGAGGLLAAAASYTDAEVLSALAISVAQGYSAADLIGAAARNFGVGESDIRRVARAGGIPGFAVGTNYVPNDMLALVHQGEAIVPAAYNPANGGNSRTDALIEGLTAEVKRLQEVVAIGNANTRRTADAVNGNPDQPVPVLTT